MASPDTNQARTRSSIMADPPGTLNLFRNTIVPFSGIAGGSGFVSNTQEPSIDANGKYIFHTGNWYATRSVNNGATWQSLNPFTQFGGSPQNFCCDQVAIYDPARNLQFWLLMGVEDPGTTGNHLQLAVSAGNDLVSWCAYDIEPSWFGEPSTTFLDYNDMALTNNFLWIANNPFPAAGGNKTGMLRIPLDALAACIGFTYNFLTVSDWFNFKPVQGATDTMYWGSVTPLSGFPVGTSFRVYMWPDATLVINTFDRVIPAFVYQTRNGGQACQSTGASAGLVNNWCNYADSRTLGGYVKRGEIGFSFNARQDGSHPFPYTRLVKFAEGTKNYLGSNDFYATNFGIEFMSWAPNRRGNLGGTFAFGGGTATPFYPGTGMVVIDDFGTTFKYINGISNACANNGITARWGDYLTTRPYHPADLVWIATAMRNVNGGPCGGGYSEVKNFVFGRERDSQAYHRWKNT